MLDLTTMDQEVIRKDKQNKTKTQKVAIYLVFQDYMCYISKQRALRKCIWGFAKSSVW